MNGESKMKNKVVKIIMWILFWFYLIPYYLVKKFLFKKAAHPIFWANCVTIGLFFVLGWSPLLVRTIQANSLLKKLL